MAGSNFGKLFRITTFGESHGAGLGVVIDGCPSGLQLSMDDIRPYLKRRRPGQNAFTTSRKEEDEIEILSGVFNGFTTGTPISMLVRNTNAHSQDYSEIAKYYRPGHADYTFDQKYGFRDYRGGGRSSGRETVSRVAAGAVAAKLLKEFGIDVMAYTRAISDISLPANILPKITREDILNSPLFMPDKECSKQASDYLIKIRQEHDSCGGVIECTIKNPFVGLGEPVFDKLDARLSAALFSIGAVKAVEIGAGCGASLLTGSENNDSFFMEDGLIKKRTNNSGGILGGLSDGDIILVRVYIKPTPSISKRQMTVDSAGNEIPIEIGGRHDPIIVPRAVVVVESMCSITIADLLLENMVSNISNLRKVYC